MESRTFRKRISLVLVDLVELRGAIEGARTLKDKSVFDETVKLKEKTLEYMMALVLEYIGEDLDPTLGTRRKTSLWPKPDQSPSSIWADMQFIMDCYWEVIGGHEDVDPGMSSSLLTSGLMRAVSNMRQKLLIARLILLERDPGFWTPAHESVWKAMDDHARLIIESGDEPLL